MSEAQLKKAIVERDKLQDELNLVKNIIKTSVACTSIQDYVSKTADPLISGTSPNGFRSKPPGSSCVII